MGDKFLFKMPDIGEGVVEGEVVAWLKHVGDKISKDEPVVVMMTDKATVELPTPYAGLLTQCFYKVGEVAKKDSSLFEIEVEGALNKTAEVPSVSPDITSLTESPKAPSLRPSSSKKILAVPPIRKLARDMGILLHQVKGTGREGRITREDLQRYHGELSSLEQSPRAEAQLALAIGSVTPINRLSGDRESPIIGIQHLMAEKMVESSHLIPHFSFFDQADATRLVQLHQKMKKHAEEEGIKLTFMPFFIRALSLVLKKYPSLNSSIDPVKNTLILHSIQNIGIAMKTSLGLIVPVLKGVEKLGLFELVYAYDALKEKGKNNQLRPADMKEATMTLTNFGALAGSGVFATPIINYPEVAILGVARIQPQPLVVNRGVEVRDVLNCSWSFDHRVIDGDLAAKVSADFTALIENPAKLL